MKPEKNNNNNPYEIATANSIDPRSESDLVVDWVDPRLTDLFHEAGLLEAGDEKKYSRNFVLDLARAAYGRGARDGSDDPEGMKKYMGEDYSAARNELRASQVKATLGEIADLPETPPDIPNH